MDIALISSPMLSCPPKEYGGLELIVWNLANGLTELGHKVVLFAPKGSKTPKKGFLFETQPPQDKVEVNWLEVEKNMWKVYDPLLDDFDIICGMNWFGMEYASKARNNDLKSCHVHHGGLNAEWWSKSKPPFKLNLIAISDWMVKVYASQCFTARRVYNGINLEDYPFKKDKGDRLLFVGRLDNFKRPLVAIEVAKKLNMGLDIVGGSFVYDVNYMESVKQACDGKQIKLCLDATHEKKVELYQNAKAVIFPSKMGEPFGLITCEANACGTPVIATPDGAIPEVLADGKTGFLCDTIDKLCEAVKKADTIDPKACKKRVEENFTKETMAKNYLALYNDILNDEQW